MNELYHNIFVGSQADYESLNLPETAFVLHAAKEPYHRSFVWYKGNCAKDHPEYLRAVRGREVALNLVDAKESKYFNFDLIFTAVQDVLALLMTNQKVYIHCNQWESRAPSIALLVLLALHVLDYDYDVAQKQFISIYPNYNPGQWISDFIKENWDTFVAASKTTSEIEKEFDVWGVQLPETTPEEEWYILLPESSQS